MATQHKTQGHVVAAGQELLWLQTHGQAGSCKCKTALGRPCRSATAKAQHTALDRSGIIVKKYAADLQGMKRDVLFV